MIDKIRYLWRQKIKVSEETSKYIGILRDIDSLWDKIYTAIEIDYKDDVDEVFNSNFETLLLDVKIAAIKQLHESVERNIWERKDYECL